MAETKEPLSLKQTSTQRMELEDHQNGEVVAGGTDIECNSLHQPLLKRNTTVSASHFALVGAKVSHIESLDYEICSQKEDAHNLRNKEDAHSIPIMVVAKLPKRNLHDLCFGLQEKCPSITSMCKWKVLDTKINENELFKQDFRQRSRNQLLLYVFLKWKLAFLIGSLTGLIATLINLAIENIAGYKLLLISNYIKQERYMMGLVMLTGINFLLTLSATLLVVFFAPTAAGTGIPEIKAYLNGVDSPNMYGVPTLLVKIIGSIGAVSAGLDLGKEEPLVHIGACIASLLGQGGNEKYHIKWRWLRLMNNDRDMRDLITCGASSGVCAAFRAPIGGVLFALEEVASWWRSALLWRTFFSTAVVVVILRAFIEYCSSGKCGLFGNDDLIMFDVSNVSVSYHIMDLIPVILIGLMGGVLGSMYNYALQIVLRLYSLINEKGKLAKILLSLTVSVFTSVCMYSLPFLVNCTKCNPSLPNAVCSTRGMKRNFKQFNCPEGYYNDLASLLFSTNYDAVRNIFSTNTPEEFHLISLLIYFTLYSILGLFTFGIAVPSGLFLPIILIGSSYGRLLGLAMKRYTNIDEGLFAVLGAASLMSGSMRMTVSLCVILLELTNNLLLLPITMLVLLISKTVGDCFNPSIYEILLKLKGLPFLDSNPEPWMRNITVGELANVKPPLVSLHGVEKVSKIVDVLKNTTHNGFPVINDDPMPQNPHNTKLTELQGLILRTHLIAVLKKKWFLPEVRQTEEWEVRERFTWAELAERDTNLEQIAISKHEMEMYVDLHPFTNRTPYTVVEDMSAAKAMVLFRQVALRHLLVVPKYHGSGIHPVIGILTRQDLRAQNIQSVFPTMLNSRGREKQR